MRLDKWISGLTFCLLTQLATGNELVNSSHATPTYGQAHALSHLITDTVNYPGEFADSTALEFADADSVKVAIQDNAPTSSIVDLLNVSRFTVLDNATNALFSTVMGRASGNAASTLAGLTAGFRTLELDGNGDDGIGGGRGNIATFNTVPLPAAAWLFGFALIGFVAFSARRSV